MKYLLIFFIFITVNHTVAAQSQNTPSTQFLNVRKSLLKNALKNFNDEIGKRKTQRMVNGKYYLDLDQVEGSPYLNKEFTSGNMGVKSETYSKEFQMRYNVYDDQIEIHNSENDNNYIMVNDSSLIYRIMEKEFIYFENDGFYEEIINDTISIYIKHECKYIPEKKAKTSYNKPIPAKFEKSEVLYLKIENALIIAPKKIKKIIDYFGKNKNEMNEYIEKNKLKIKNKKDLVRVIEYYNLLVKREENIPLINKE